MRFLDQISNWMFPKRDSKLIMTLLVRDEQDIIRENIEFHLSQGVSFFIVTDNLSTDGTAAILKEYEEMGVLRYIFEESDCFDQKKWVTRMAISACRDFGADWVINNDADEFWWPHGGRLIDIFNKTPKTINVLEATRSNFVYMQNENDQFYQRMIYRQVRSCNGLGELLPPKVAHRGYENVSVGPGNHGVGGIPGIRMMPAAIDILHFPMRSRTQFENKILIGGAALKRNEMLPEENGHVWRALHGEFEKNGGLQQYCSQNAYDLLRIERELASGEIIEDQRLADYLCPLMTHTRNE